MNSEVLEIAEAGLKKVHESVLAETERLEEAIRIGDELYAVMCHTEKELKAIIREQDEELRQFREAAAKSESITALQAVEKLRQIKVIYGYDPEAAHPKADDVLLELINNEDVAQAWDEIPKWWS
jgi:hypothetical protein